ncbi:hypothetical protein [Pseudoalteromonas sp. MMG012]|uniref:hypothetical protein n=1 Tax=Pseudoalteromonas sp. MMG012 TaxID=2822686 RepID=UPI001B3A5E02|nr:hypothetical protein [Pseudoalteromonas sp. MMG012]MBQ4849296.1 hypothetical protein [Pseudoalteromonas sp. MMG012]
MSIYSNTLLLTLMFMLMLVSGCSTFVYDQPAEVKVRQEKSNDLAKQSHIEGDAYSAKIKNSESTLVRHVQVTPSDRIKLKGHTIKKGDRVYNVTTGQIGTVTGEFLVELYGSQQAPDIKQFVKQPVTGAIVRYKVISTDVDLLSRLESLRGSEAVKSVELQIFYNGKVNNEY